MNKIIQKIIFKLRWKYPRRLSCWFRKLFLQFLGMYIGQNTVFGKLYTTWPNQVHIGKDCILEHNIYLKFDGIWKTGRAIFIDDNVFIGSGCEFNITNYIHIGKNSLIASGCRFIDHDHGIKSGELIGPQLGKAAAIHVGEDVWLGCNVVVLKGVNIGDGAVVAAGAVVTKSILENEIWAGVPARKLGVRI